MSSAALEAQSQAQSPLIKYLSENKVQEKLTQAIKKVLKERPNDPVSAIGQALVKSSHTLRTLSWNMAAINNNPFEYWLTHPDPEYDILMSEVERLMSDPGSFDKPVTDVFTTEMFEQLDQCMNKAGFEGDGQKCREYFFNNLSNLRIVTDFMKDKGLGNKRLMSMPDRMTNTIDVLDEEGNAGSYAYRPAVISSFAGEMATVKEWWPLWLKFMFEDKIQVPGKKGATAAHKLPCELLGKIPRSKYPAVTEEEEEISVRLQTVCLAIFDAIMVYMLQTLTPDGKWIVLKQSILEALTIAKEPKQIKILKEVYKDTEVIFLQEVRTSTMRKALPDAFQAEYKIVVPQTPSKADQNSIVLLSKARFEEASVVDLTAEALALVPNPGPSISDGDLLVFSADEKGTGRTIMFASFHGDTDGLATDPALEVVHKLFEQRKPAAVIFGLDANTYATPKPGKQAGVKEFIENYQRKGYASNFGDARPDACITTANARTFLQPQLQKACKASEKRSHGDFNPKDHLLVTASAYEIVSGTSGKDNTGKKSYVEEMVIPTTDWPSDHGLIYCELKPK